MAAVQPSARLVVDSGQPSVNVVPRTKRQRQPSWRARKQAAQTNVAHYRVYVVRLDHPRARGRECFYVGMTGLDVEERFNNHKRGYKASSVVRRYGVELAREWFDDIPPMPYEEAVLAEPTLADDLRDLGYLVFGPTNRKPTLRINARGTGKRR